MQIYHFALVDSILTVLVINWLAVVMALSAYDAVMLCNLIYHTLSENNSEARREQRISGESATKSGDVFRLIFTMVVLLTLTLPCMHSILEFLCIQLPLLGLLPSDRSGRSL